MTRVVCLPSVPLPRSAATLRGLKHVLASITSQTGDTMVLPNLADGQVNRGSDIGGIVASEADHPVLAVLQGEALCRQCHVVIPSLAIIDEDGACVHRSLVLNGAGSIIARRDLPVKPGMVLCGEPKSAGGQGVVTVETKAGLMGLCSGHDLASALQCRRTGQTGAEILVITPTGQGSCTDEQWSILNRARAIETCAYVIAPALADAESGNGTITPPAMLVDPWGRVLATGRGAVIESVFDPAAVRRTRAQIPSLDHDRPYQVAAGDGCSSSGGPARLRVDGREAN